MDDRAFESRVCIVDDDDDARFGLKLLLETAGYLVEDFDSAASFLEEYTPGPPTCLILDLHMPSISGLELQEKLAERDMMPPIIFLTGHGSVPSAVQALKSGAVDYLQKPVANDNLLLDRVSEAIRQHKNTLAALRQRNQALARLSELTPRETQVMDLICEGMANKVIAVELGISERTVELHRGRVMHKLEVRSVPELIELTKSASA